ncbi:hypothetical protein FRB97_001801 [Tulasnella sp. 331]|nr:hypothetical protein FRB97_001801 [Tulasnella sp. 331]
MYPLILQGRLDHDVQQDGIGIPDFVDFLIGFPFIDLLGDGYSTFTWTPSSFMAVDVVSIAGTELYGINVTTAIFDPPNDQYAFVPASENPTPGAIYFTATSLLGSTLVSAVYAPMASGGIGQYPLSFYQNVTNQPTFGNGIVCDNQIRFFNTPITQGDYLPIGIQGNITIADPNMPQLSATYTNVFGVKLDTAFIENNLQNCTSLKGDTYQGE